MALKYPDRIESNNPQAYGIVKATEVSGAKNAAEYGGLLSIPDKILSASGDGSDALYQLWIDDNSVYRLVDWNNRHNSKGWRLEYSYIEWGSNNHLNSFTESGQYYISGQSNGLNGGLPILNSDPGHTFDAVLRVLDSSLTKDENEKQLCITQILSLSNRMGGDGHIFVRTIQTLEKYNLTRTDIESPTCNKWGTWEKLQGIFEKNVVEQPVHLNTYTTNGMYSGVFVNPDTVGGLRINTLDTFLLITVNGHAAASVAQQMGLNKAPQLTQLLYITPIETGQANLYTRTATWNGSQWVFGNFYRLATSEDINSIRTGALYQFNIVPTKDNVKFVTSNLNDFIVGEVNMLQASATQAGVMSAEDKIKLDNLLQDTPWEGHHMNAFTETGEYHIHGERTNANDGLPILNAGSGHTIDARLTVLDSSLTNGTGEKTDTVVTQILRLSNRTGGDGHVYVRTAQAANKSQLATPSSTAWGTWEKLMGIFEKNAVTNIADLDTYTTNGMYSGLFAKTTLQTLGGLQFTPGDTFLMVTVNGYAASAFGAPQLTQMLYKLPSKKGSGNSSARMYMRTAYWNKDADPKAWVWANWDRLALASEISGGGGGSIEEYNRLIELITANTDKITSVESTANSAKSAAETAKTAADTAQETANSARETATAASTAAQEAKTASETAQSTATAASAAAAAAKQAAENEATARTEADTELQLKIGELSDLNTIEKTSIVNAINEVKQSGEGIKEYKLLHSHTFTEDATSSDYELLTADDGTPINQFKDILILAELSYVKDGSTMTIYLNTTKSPKGYIAQIVSQSFTTHYIFKLKIDGLNTTLYSENHTNAFSNPQFADGNQGRNFMTFYPIGDVFTYDRLTINFPFKANNSIKIYGR